MKDDERKEWEMREYQGRKEKIGREEGKERLEQSICYASFFYFLFFYFHSLLFSFAFLLFTKANRPCRTCIYGVCEFTYPSQDFLLEKGNKGAKHYYVIMDETGIPPDDFQAICNNMCYTYIRSTTAVSLSKYLSTSPFCYRIH